MSCYWRGRRGGGGREETWRLQGADRDFCSWGGEDRSTQGEIINGELAYRFSVSYTERESNKKEDPSPRKERRALVSGGPIKNRLAGGRKLRGQFSKGEKERVRGAGGGGLPMPGLVRRGVPRVFQTLSRLYAGGTSYTRRVYTGQDRERVRGHVSWFLRHKACVKSADRCKAGAEGTRDNHTFTRPHQRRTQKDLGQDISSCGLRDYQLGCDLPLTVK